MDGEHLTTIKDEETLIKIESYAAIQRAKEILGGLAAIALLRMQAAEGTDFSPSFLRDLYKDSPWEANSGAPAQVLPAGLEEDLNQVIFRQVSVAWHELTEKAERIFEPNFFINIWHKRYQQEGEEQEAGEESQQGAPASPPQWKGPSPANLVLIEATRNNIEARADKLINQDPAAPLGAAEVAKIGQGIKVWAANITKDIAA